jgi:two-component system chemotaxis response regulator CheB
VRPALPNGVYMAVKVLVVDDSGFFRRRVSEILASDSGIQVVGTATNGKEAIDQALALKPDVITMDYEMPMMDGITAVRHIMQRCPTPARSRSPFDVFLAYP